MSKKKEKTSAPSKADLQTYRVASSVTLCCKKTFSEDINLPLVLCYLKTSLVDKKLEISRQFTVSLFGQPTDFAIVKIDPEPKEDEIMRGTNKTVVVLSSEVPKEDAVKMQEIAKKPQQQLYGMEKQTEQLCKTIRSSISGSNRLESFGLNRIKGILIQGISGMGKSTMVKYLKKLLTPINFKIYNSFNLLSRVVGGAEQFVKKVFSEAKNEQPCVIVFEDLHLLFAKKGSQQENETTLSALLTELESLEEEDRVIVLGTSNVDRELDSNIKRAGRFQKEVILELPAHKQRQAIIKGLIKNIPNEMTDADVHQVNLRLNGFSNSEIKQIVREAFLMNEEKLTIGSLMAALKNFRPAGIKQLLVEVPEVFWSEIGGYDKTKEEIRKAVEWPLKHQNAYKKMNIEPIKGIMLYGPPGCSKTMMAKAIATESKLNFLAVKGPELFSKYVGESEKAVRNIFKRARSCSPCIIFFDQIDALATQRSIKQFIYSN